ncbi:anthranilate synthase component II [Nocardioides caeni]|uniref:Aminodeoxychorismate/anthranilate synthase component II n=1 Tax=Nocardioides caeni TaxID=574700 RepID=A0A4S8MZM9_9ACTN|nr:aminodeoxychorismate/anthranilate synthase component II [Nocardioides caeni]THV08947.1 aminodeoxychorismate/anthranilate synthase component II [Nocardioides caeni]
MTADVVVVDHHDSYTWNLVHLVAGVTGVLPTVVQWDEPVDLASYSHIVLSPGPGHPDEYRWEHFGQDRPVLGVCLGLQAMVVAFGGEVGRVGPAHGTIEQVTHDGRGVFAGLPATFDAVRYHSLAAVRLSDQLEATAWAGDGTLMGARHRSLPIEGVQFHPESVLSEHGARLVANFLGAAGPDGPGRPEAGVSGPAG